ncbi:hypothetical protein EHQ27_06365 [Leptospira wolffii]|uniref:hypothetical protein n=1 Tax=Leptospira wolffii TaxID=409998 RepID=UPI001082A991|nr:hypothetical protein [Leptospira wolffii]TGK55982.1 hypothetical protein EHQ32_16300 [Leptospira wolffii]TGK72028.1 hypothetical protein EHQ35_11735 [Leptospira wolffii]TGK73693.1 hypothetical protein EHQ27_06365 [Leptospira wolffii]TGL27605.1 hypothetical protein EHQ57_14560 [Leptospira wolffii]
MNPTIQETDLYREFLKEKKSNRRWELAGYILGYGAYAIILYIVFALKRENPQLSALFFYGLLTRSSSLLIGRFFLVPKIFLGLLSLDEKTAISSWETIQNHKEEIIGRLARNIFGWNDASGLFSMDRSALTEFIREHTKIDWRKAGIYYLYFYVPISLFLIYLTIAAWYA